MSFIKRWFAKKESEDWEQVLSSLAIDIKKRQTRLSEIRLRERRATLAATLYMLIAWGTYIALWYLHLLPNVLGKAYAREDAGAERFVKTLPVLGGPIVILFIRRVMQLWYSRIGAAEENTLKALLTQQRTKIEDIKKKTNYYSTRNLLERYDDDPRGSSSATPHRPGGPGGPGGPSTPIRPRMLPGGMTTPGQTPGQNGPGGGGVAQMMSPNGPGSNGSPTPPNCGADLERHFTPSPPVLPPAHKQWYDRLADTLLGDDVTTDPSTTRYALICAMCRNHNGLVREQDIDTTSYQCPKCGYFNESRRGLQERARTGRSISPSPLSGMPFTPFAPSSATTLDQGQGFASSPVQRPVGLAPPGHVPTSVSDSEGEEEEAEKSMEVDS